MGDLVVVLRLMSLEQCEHISDKERSTESEHHERQKIFKWEHIDSVTRRAESETRTVALADARYK